MNDIEFHLYEEVKAGRLSRRAFLVRASLWGLSAAAISATLGSPFAARKAYAQAQKGGKARLGMRAPPADADPVSGYSDGGTRLAQAAAEYLCYPMPDYTLDPRLATSWTSSDAKAWTFKIREGVKWQDGSPLTAEDVVATFDRLVNPDVKSAAKSSFKGILEMGQTEKVDDYTVTFHLSRPYVNFPYLTSAFNYNTVILPKNYEEGSKLFTKGGIGSGAFIITSFSPEEATLVRNPNYWDPSMPHLDELTLKFFEDTTAMALALQGGAIDGLTSLPQSAAPPLFSDANIVVLQNHSSDYRTLQMRVDIEPFNDKRLRQAVAWSLDREAIVQAIYGPRASIGNDHGFAPIFPDSKVTEQIEQRKQNYDKARALMAEAGKADGFAVTLTTEQYLEIPQYAVFVKDHAKGAGIDVTLDIQPQNTYYGSGDNQPWLSVPFGITDWAPRGNPSDTITPAYTCAAPWNSAHWCNEDFDAAMREYDGSVDEQKRLAAALKAATIQHEEVPAVIAYWGDTLRAANKKLQGLAKGPNALDARALWMAS
jgi:peptide/nickel transport system substrate-binding protein